VKNTRLNEAETGRATFSRAWGKRRNLLPAAKSLCELLCTLGTPEFDYQAHAAFIQSVIKKWNWGLASEIFTFK